MVTLSFLQIFRHFGPDRSPYYNRAVQLFWALHECAPSREVETLVSESMFPSGMTAAHAVEAFGVLWRFSGTREAIAPTSHFLTPNADDATLPGFRLRIPLLAVLDTIKSDNPTARRVGETWMRSSLKSYVRCAFHTGCIQRNHLSL